MGPSVLNSGQEVDSSPLGCISKFSDPDMCSSELVFKLDKGILLFNESVIPLAVITASAPLEFITGLHTDFSWFSLITEIARLSLKS